jgi:hypothetical protein
VPIGLVLSVAGAAVVGAWKIASALKDFQSKQAEEIGKVFAKLSTMEAGLNQCWRVPDMHEWTEVGREANPEFHFPKVSEIRPSRRLGTDKT